MIRYTTPTIKLTIDYAIPEEAEVYASFSQGSLVVTKYTK